MSSAILTGQRKFRSQKKSNRIALIADYIVLSLLSLIWIIPILWIFLHAFRVQFNDAGEINGNVVSNFFPTRFGFDNFIDLFTFNMVFIQDIGNLLNQEFRLLLPSVILNLIQKMMVLSQSHGKVCVRSI